MSDGICIIPAKGKSRRCPNKNVRIFHGIPMVARAIRTAQECGLFSQVVVSTDLAEVGVVAEQYGARVKYREHNWEELGTQELAARVLQQLGTHRSQSACVLYATTPLVVCFDLIEASRRFDPTCDNFIMAVGAEPLRDAGAFYMGLAGDFFGRKPLIGSATRLYVLPESRVCDVNTERDFARAEALYNAMTHA